MSGKRWAGQLVAGLLVGIPVVLYAVGTQETTRRPVRSGRAALEASEAVNSSSRFSREQWNLTETEWGRYLELMQGVRGSISPSTLSPIEVLGIHARSDAERERYAREWVDLMREDTERVLAFTAAVREVERELNPSGAIIDLEKVKALSSPIEENAVLSGDRVLLFLRLRNCPECQGLYTRIRRAAFDADTELDIYFTDTKTGQDDDAILQWAQKMRFNGDRLAAHKISFNHDGGALRKAGGESAQAPAAFRIRNGLIDPLKIGMPGL